MENRVGLGYDIHRLTEGRPFILGGVTIPYEKGLLGHSDADVLIHSIIDALLGAVAKGDIGTLFPDTDEAYRGADSTVLLSRVVELVYAEGWRIENLDCNVLCQRPKLMPHIAAIRSVLSQVMTLDVTRISVKAKTGEGVGPVGEGLAVEAQAIVLLSKE